MPKIHIPQNVADRIYVFNNGNTNLFGNHEQLMKSDNFYSKFWKQL
jgi:ATP-binding cassette subfamily B protein